MAGIHIFNFSKDSTADKERIDIKLLFTILVFSILASSGNALAAVADIQRLLDEGQVEQAYAHALSLQAVSEGEPDYDFLLGMAAVKTGRLPPAVFAFERVLILRPDDHRARLELARVYFLQKDYNNAKTEFNNVLAQNPPTNVKTRIDFFLIQIKKQIIAQKRRTSSRLSFALGHDSNVNSATSEQSVDVPFLGSILLTDESRETGDQFTETAVAGDVEYRLSGQSYMAAGMNLIARKHFREDGFDTTSGGFVLRYRLKRSSHEWKLPVLFQQFNVSGNAFRRMLATGVDYSYSFSRQQISFNSQFGLISFPDHVERDAKLASGGLGWRYRFQSGRSFVYSAIYFGQEDTIETIAQHNGRQYTGIRLAGQYDIAKKLKLFAGVIYQTVKHQENDIVFSKIRKDQFKQLTIGGSWYLNRRWSFEINVQDLLNDSNLPVYEYDRVQVRGGINYAF